MQQHDSPEQATDGLSPVKRALIEIRQLREELAASRRATHEPIAIIGMALRLPGGVTSPERFWSALTNGEDLITTVPSDRWDACTYWSPELDEPGTMYDVHGGFLDQVDAFDAEFFGIHPRESASMDPQQRLLLELTWEALERGGINPHSLMDTQTGVFLGLSNSDYGRKLLKNSLKVDGYTGVGAAASIAAGRIAYFLGTHGPAMVIDTACSSSLVALHQAVQSLRQRETELALVGGVNLLLSPELSVGFSRSRMLSPTGRSRTFDAAADGYVRAEACCVVVLKRLADAERDGDRVLAKILGTAINQDGRSAGMTAPNGPSQEAVMRAALADSGLAPASVTYVEAHGTGTPLGDPMEFHAIGNVYGKARGIESPLRVGSVKTNLGHTEAAAGLAGLVKVVLMMQPGGGIPAHLHLNDPSSQIEWDRWPIEVPTKLVSWSNESETQHAGLSSFGFSGTNAHVILASHPSSMANSDTGPDEASKGQEFLLCLSAANKAALSSMARLYVDYLRQTDKNFQDICATAATYRAKLRYRLALRAPSTGAAAATLENWLAEEPVSGLLTTADVEDGGIVSEKAEVDSLEKIQRDFVQGRELRYPHRKPSTLRHRVDLPLYPFQRKVFWFDTPQPMKLQGMREDAWRSACVEAERQSKQGPLGWNPEGYAERWRMLERLTLAHAQTVLAEREALPEKKAASVDIVMQRCGFQAIYRNLVTRWLRGLAKQGVLTCDGEEFLASHGLQAVNLALLWQETASSLADNPGVLLYLQRCGALLGDVLTGRKSALETLFPEGSFALAEGLYEESAEARYLNPIVGQALRAAVHALGEGRRTRILEIGGGTGGTTSTVLPLLPTGQVEYWFSDLSDLFLNRARVKFKNHSFIRYARFDLERDPEEQELRETMFDLIVAANVVHAARNLDDALARVRRLLSPGGILVLLETTCHQAWFDMSTGLIEGWQHFEDSIRQEHPLLDVSQWHRVLARNGFEHLLALPSLDVPASLLGQHVILAKKPEDNLRLAPDGIEYHSAVRSSPTMISKLGHLSVPHDSVASDDLSGLSAEALKQVVSIRVKQTICRIFQLDLDPEAIGERDRLTDLGMDSLIALELRGELAVRLGLGERLSSTIAFETGTVEELVRALVDLLVPTYESPERTALKTYQTEPILVTEERLQEMSEEEVEQLLKERLGRL